MTMSARYALINAHTAVYICSTYIIRLCITISLTVSIISLQIGDFGMARDITDASFYMSSGGLIPVRWTAPEVS